jgi:DNA polymerase V
MPQTKTETRGGARLNAGRKKGSSAYGESTKAIRVPESMVPTVKALLGARKAQFEQLANSSSVILFPAKTPSLCVLPLFGGKVAAGFPSPADDYVEKTLDLNELLVQKPAATFFVRAQGESMLGAGIHPNDIRMSRSALGNIHTAISEWADFRGCNYSFIFRPVDLLAIQVAPTALYL